MKLPRSTLYSPARVRRGAYNRVRLQGEKGLKEAEYSKQLARIAHRVRLHLDPRRRASKLVLECVSNRSTSAFSQPRKHAKKYARIRLHLGSRRRARAAATTLRKKGTSKERLATHSHETRARIASLRVTASVMTASNDDCIRARIAIFSGGVCSGS